MRSNDFFKYMTVAATKHRFCHIVECHDKAVKRLVIPAEIDGFPVTRVEPDAFRDCDSLTTLVIPKEARNIACWENALKKCRTLEAILVDPEHPNCIGIDGVLFYSRGLQSQLNLLCYPNAKADTEYTLPGTVTGIPNFSFAGQKNLKHINLPEGLSSIGICAFKDCTALSEIRISASVQSISSDAFEGCSSLAQIHVAPENSCFESIDGVLFKKDSRELLAYPGRKPDLSYQIPAGTEKVAVSAFSGCSALRQISIPSSVSAFYARLDTTPMLTEIHVDSDNEEFVSVDGVLFSKNKSTLIAYPANRNEAFYRIPASVCKIKAYAFSGCRNLQEVYFHAGISVMERRVFAGCSSLRKAVFAYRDPAIGIRRSFHERISGGFSYEKDVFEECPKLTVYAPQNSSAHYFAAQNHLPFIATADSTSRSTVHAGYWYMHLQDVGSDGWLILMCRNGQYTAKWNACVSRHDKDGDTIYLPQLSGLTAEALQSILEKKMSQRLSNVRIGLHVPTLESLNAMQDLLQVFEEPPVSPSLPDPEEEEAARKFLTELNFRYNWGCLLGCWELPEGKIFVPEMPGIKEVYIKAFQDCQRITDIVLPDSMVEIGASAFENCKSLTYIHMPADLRKIEQDAFSGCASLQEITIPKGVQKLGSNALRGCTGLHGIHVDKENEHYESLDGVLFSKSEASLILYPGKKADTHYQIPQGTREICKEAFYRCERLTHLTIPASVTQIAAGVFEGCVNLTHIEVDGNNPHYESVNGVLYTKGQERLLCYPANRPGRLYQIPDCITEMDPYAFAYNTQLEMVLLPDTLTQIPTCAFYQAKNLLTADIPNSVQSIGFYAFSGCRSLSYVSLSEQIQSLSLCFWDCESLVSIHLPQSIRRLTTGDFHGCVNLAEVSVAGDNRFFTSEEGVLFTKNARTLIFYPPGKLDAVYRIPHTVQKIEQFAFSNCSHLREVWIPEWLPVGFAEFQKCPRLAAITNGHTPQIGTIIPGNILGQEHPGDWYIMLRDYRTFGYLMLQRSGNEYSVHCKLYQTTNRAIETNKSFKIAVPSQLTIEDLHYRMYHSIPEDILNELNMPSLDEMLQMEGLQQVFKPITDTERK